MSLVFDRPAFKAGVMVVEYQNSNGDLVELYLKPSDLGRELSEIPAQDEGAAKAFAPGLLLSPAEQAAKANARAQAKADGKAPVF